MAELAKLLGFMSAWDRKDTLQKYEAIIDSYTDFEELVATIGTPTKLAISLALNYVPSPAPVSIPVEAEVTEEVQVDFPEITPAGEEGDASPILITEDVPEAEEEPEVIPQRPARKVRFFGLLASVLFTIIIGIPIALVLICIGLPFVVSGLGLGAGVVWAALAAIPMLALFSDILAVIGEVLFSSPSPCLFSGSAFGSALNWVISGSVVLSFVWEEPSLIRRRWLPNEKGLENRRNNYARAGGCRNRIRRNRSSHRCQPQQNG